MRSWRWYSKVLFALLVAAFTYLGWPTPWYYVPPAPGSAHDLGTGIVRVHRVTGEVQRVRAGYWEQMVPPWSKARPWGTGRLAEEVLRGGTPE
jgi:hypothetical protein